MDDLRILVTNDDGIDAPGIASLYEELTAVGEVMVIAPAENQSGVGRTRNGSVAVADHPWGFEIHGTPADCVAFGVGMDEPDFDVVVSGVNDGPNVGNYVVGRSGTVGAGIEAAFLGVPAIAVSAYHSEEFHCFPAEAYDFDRPAKVARELLEQVGIGAVFDDVDLLNVNAPVDVAGPDIRLTRMVADYGQHVEFESDDTAGDTAADGGAESERSGRTVDLVDRTWPHVTGWDNPLPGVESYRDRYPEDSDRLALVDGDVSVSPLSITHEFVESPTLADALGTSEIE